MRLPGFEADAAVYRSSRSYATLSAPARGGSETGSQVDLFSEVTPAACYEHCFENPLSCSRDCISTCGYNTSTPLCLSGETCCTSLNRETFECCTSGEVCLNGACSSCPSGLTACSGVCVNLQNDPNNCGGCRQTCIGGTCVAGACTCPSGSSPSNGLCCPMGQSNSNGVCCSPGLVGTNGICCPPGQTGCGGDCVDTQSDTNNCGFCGNQCSGGQTCTQGACMGGGSGGLCGASCYLACAGGFLGCGLGCLPILFAPPPVDVLAFVLCLGAACGSGAAVCALACPPSCG